MEDFKMKKRYEKILYNYLIKEIVDDRLLFKIGYFWESRDNNNFEINITGRIGLLMHEMSNNRKLQLLKEIGNKFKNKPKITLNYWKNKQWIRLHLKNNNEIDYSIWT